MEVYIGSEVDSYADLIAGWLANERSTLLAIDAPLGWPAPLGELLVNHQAGLPLDQRPEKLFNRYTDRFVRRKIGRRPLEVGADRIARTALAALDLLRELREKSGSPIPLAWQPEMLSAATTCAIEVYPAATLAACRQVGDLKLLDYKKPKARETRMILLGQLRQFIEIKAGGEKLIASPDALDAAVCVLAGNDFLLNRCFQPEEGHEADLEKEGWIWVRRPPAPLDSPRVLV
jgi:predicted RNase H-like nuclease